MYPGAHTVIFQPDKLSVLKIDNRWAIVTPEQPLLWFGDKPDEAAAMLDIIRWQQFDQLCRIGDEHGLTFFVHGR